MGSLPVGAADGDGRLFALPTYTAMLALRDLLTPDQRARYEAAVTKLGMPAGAFDRFEPWYATLMLAVVPLAMLASMAATRVAAAACAAGFLTGPDAVNSDWSTDRPGLCRQILSADLPPPSPPGRRSSVSVPIRAARSANRRGFAASSGSSRPTAGCRATV